jgi:hypothetical protein
MLSDAKQVLLKKMLLFLLNVKAQDNLQKLSMVMKVILEMEVQRQLIYLLFQLEQNNV